MTTKDTDVKVDASWWADPLPKDYYKDGGSPHPGAVLLAEDIRWYVEHGLLFDKVSFEEERLKGASYAMAPDSDGGWCFNESGVQQALIKRRDDKGEYFAIPKNSLAYIRLKECLRIPFYIIGRHNLKIDYIYKGLLLGTGPQVDPGFRGHLFIPLHNLTNCDTNIYLEESFVSIDFVRTCALQLPKGTPKSEKEFREMYPEKKAIAIRKIKERTTLQEYLGTSKPLGSLAAISLTLEKIRFVQRKLELGGLLALLGIVGGVYLWVNNKCALLPVLDFRIQTVEKMLGGPQSDKLVKLETTQSKLLDVDNLQKRIRELEARIAQLEKRSKP